MANAVCLTFTNSIPAPIKPSNSRCVLIPKSTFSFQNPRRVQTLKAKSEDSIQSTKINSILCPECTGNGAIECTQCKGNGVNSVDHFNGQFKAGALCWLCRGKREILCGNCNGAGFMGGFLSTYDE